MIFKRERCPACKLMSTNPEGKNKPCPRCGATMKWAGDTWHIGYYYQGRKVTEAAGPRRSMAVELLARRRVEIADNKYRPRQARLTWDDAVEGFRAWLPLNVKSKTQAMYENSLKALGPLLSGMTLANITPTVAERFKRYRLEQGMAAGTVNRDLATIKRVLSVASQDKITMLKETHRCRMLSEDEKERLFKAIEDSGAWRLRLAVLIALNTGLRKDNIQRLRWPQIDFQAGMIQVVGKGGKDLRVPPAPGLMTELRAIRAESKVLSMYVLPSPRNFGRPWAGLDDAWRGALRAADIEDFRFHDLRHTFASWFAMTTGDLKVLQEILGHSSLRTTERYVHLLEKHKKEVMEKAGKAVI